MNSPDLGGSSLSDLAGYAGGHTASSKYSQINEPSGNPAGDTGAARNVFAPDFAMLRQELKIFWR
jgi:hypothetical protein